MEKKMDDLTQINWLQQVAFDYLKQQKRQRRMRFVFKLLIITLLFIAFVVGANDPSNKPKATPHVAVIDIEGGIFAKARADAEHFSKALKKVHENDKVKAVMLDINSPGGSPVQADEMYNALVKFRKEHPQIKVHAVCSDLCASAAYFVAAGADTISANPSSMVGSIGVLFNGFGFTGAMDKLGISRRLITAGKYKGFLDPFSPESAQDKQKLQVMLDLVHQQFKDAVVKGRGKRLKITDDTFSGLLWTGAQAKEMGLIDDFGSIRDGYPKLPRVNYSGRDGFFDRLQQQFGESMAGELLNRIGIGQAPLR